MSRHLFVAFVAVLFASPEAYGQFMDRPSLSRGAVPVQRYREVAGPYSGQLRLRSLPLRQIPASLLQQYPSRTNGMLIQGNSQSSSLEQQLGATQSAAFPNQTLGNPSGQPTPAQPRPQVVRFRNMSLVQVPYGVDVKGPGGAFPVGPTGPQSDATQIAAEQTPESSNSQFDIQGPQLPTNPLANAASVADFIVGEESAAGIAPPQVAESFTDEASSATDSFAQQSQDGVLSTDNWDTIDLGSYGETGQPAPPVTAFADSDPADTSDEDSMWSGSQDTAGLVVADGDSPNDAGWSESDSFEAANLDTDSEAIHDAEFAKEIASLEDDADAWEAKTLDSATSEVLSEEGKNHEVATATSSADITEEATEVSEASLAVIPVAIEKVLEPAAVSETEDVSPVAIAGITVDETPASVADQIDDAYSPANEDVDVNAQLAADTVDASFGDEEQDIEDWSDEEWSDESWTQEELAGTEGIEFDSSEFGDGEAAQNAWMEEIAQADTDSDSVDSEGDEWNDDELLAALAGAEDSIDYQSDEEVSTEEVSTEEQPALEALAVSDLDSGLDSDSNSQGIEDQAPSETVAAVALAGDVEATEAGEVETASSSWRWLLACGPILLFPAAWLWWKRQESKSQETFISATAKPVTSNLLPGEVSVNSPAATAPVATAKQDDLTALRGVTPPVCSLLNALGIRSFQKLSEAKADDLRALIAKGGMQGKVLDPSVWVQQAWFAARDDWASLEKWQAMNAHLFEDPGAPVRDGDSEADDLTRIRGIDADLAKFLASQGVTRFEQLSSYSLRNLQTLLKDAGAKYANVDPQPWPGLAALASRGDWKKLNQLNVALEQGLLDTTNSIFSTLREASQSGQSLSDTPSSATPQNA